MDLDLLNTELTAARDKAIEVLGSAPKDKKSLYREAYDKAEGRITDLWLPPEFQPGGELGQGCFDGVAS